MRNVLKRIFFSFWDVVKIVLNIRSIFCSYKNELRMLISFAQLLNAMHPAPFFDDTNAFFNADEIKKGDVSILLKFIADMGRAFPLAFRLLNLDLLFPSV